MDGDAQNGLQGCGIVHFCLSLGPFAARPVPLRQERRDLKGVDQYLLRRSVGRAQGARSGRRGIFALTTGLCGAREDELIFYAPRRQNPARVRRSAPSNVVFLRS
jgi:hypothetical protein